jgi:hypothetical protein
LVDEVTRQRLGLLYVRDYKALNDLLVVFRAILR